LRARRQRQPRLQNDVKSAKGLFLRVAGARSVPQPPRRQDRQVTPSDFISSTTEDDATNATLEEPDIECDQESKRAFECPQVRDDLSDMNSGELLDGFEFHDQLAAHEQIDATFTDAESFVL
jgi:hypothetical protein